MNRSLLFYSLFLYLREYFLLMKNSTEATVRIDLQHRHCIRVITLDLDLELMQKRREMPLSFKSEASPDQIQIQTSRPSTTKRECRSNSVADFALPTMSREIPYSLSQAKQAHNKTFAFVRLRCGRKSWPSQSHSTVFVRFETRISISISRPRLTVVEANLECRAGWWVWSAHTLRLEVYLSSD